MPPRIRTIKPEIWQDERLGSCPIGARLLFIGIITQADDDGRLRGAPSLLRSMIFPYDESLSTRRVSEWLGALADARLIRRYTAGGEALIDLPSWSKHQRVERATRSALSPHEQRDKTEQTTPNAGNSVSPHRDLTEASATPHRDLTAGSGSGRDQDQDLDLPRRRPSRARTHETTATEPALAAPAAHTASPNGRRPWTDDDEEDQQ